MRFTYFANRNLKELLRDPLSLILGVLMPVTFVFFFSTIAKNIPADVFQPVNIVPGLTVFGCTFTTMFLGLLIARDKSSSFLTRLFITPLTSTDFIAGYFYPLFLFSLLISISCLLVGTIVGVPVSFRLLYTFFSFFPFILLSVFIGVFLGVVFNETQIIAIGNIYIIVCSILGGAWMDVSILGEKIKSFAEVLPFLHATELSRIVLSGRPDKIWFHLLIVCSYAIVFFLLSVFFFNRKMKSDNK